ncbi:MAG: hypothetical protein GY850_18250 [bacterium]|nr:hypothetical protein [bacterium]
MKGYFSWNEDLLKQAVARSETSGNIGARAVAAENYGHYLGAIGQYVTAIAYFDQLIDLTNTEEAKYQQAMFMASGGRCYCTRAGHFDKALRFAAGAREIEKAMGDARLRAWCAMEAEPYLYKGIWDQVIRIAVEGQTAAWEIGEWGVIFWLAGWLGIAYLKLGHIQEAKRVIDRALNESQARSFGPFAVTYLQITAAQLHLALGEPDKALGAARKAIQMAEGSRLRLGQGAANRVLGQVYEASGNREEADAVFYLSMQILSEIQSRPELAQTLLAYGRFKVSNDPAAERVLIERALSLFEEMGAKGWINEALAALDL